MKRSILLVLVVLTLVLPLSSCSKAPDGAEDGTLHITAATYPIWVFAENLLPDVEGIELELMVDQQISCVHDYTLSVNDMLKLERSDLLLLNGAGFDVFLEDALASYPDLPRVDCSSGIVLQEACRGAAEHDHGDHDHAGHDHTIDSHIWLDPRNAALMTENIAAGLCRLLPEQAETISANCDAYLRRLDGLYNELSASLQALSCRELITFHDGFGYFARAFGLTLLHSIEEEAGSEASAGEITEIIRLIGEHGLPAIFVERNGSDATALAIASETGISVGTLDMVISGEKNASGYEDAMRANAAALLEHLA